MKIKKTFCTFIIDSKHIYLPTFQLVVGCDVTTYKLGLSDTMLVVETLLCFFAN